MFVENVQGKAGDQGIAQAILLIEKAGVGARFNIIPGAPLVDNQPNALVRVILIHDRTMVGDDFFHTQRFLQREKPIIHAKFSGGALVCPGVRDGVIVDAEAMHVASGFAHHGFGPRVVKITRPTGDLVDFVRAIVAHKGLVAAVDGGIFTGRHIAATAPVFVAHAKVFDAPRRLPPIRLPFCSQGRIAFTGHVLNPILHLLHGAAAHIAGNVGFTI